MILCFDIDALLQPHAAGTPAEALPEAVAAVNYYYDAGHTIKLHAYGDADGATEREHIVEQLRDWGVRYHELIAGKPRADVYIDARAVNATSWQAQLPALPDPQRGLSTVTSGRAANSILTDQNYLQVTYSDEIAPIGPYPLQLATYLHERIFRRSGRILDIGCGRGEFLTAFDQLGYEPAGADISMQAASWAKQFPVAVVDLEHEQLPYADNEFDFVFSKSVIEHMRTPSALMAEGLRVLKPGGTAVMMTPSWIHNRWGPFYIDHTHVTVFTIPGLSDALTVVGYVDVETRHFYQLPGLWKAPWMLPLVKLFALLPLPYRPFNPRAPRWPMAINKCIRFSKEVMLLSVARKAASSTEST